MRKLLLVLIALIAIVTFIKAFDGRESEALNGLHAVEAGIDN